MTEKFRLGQTVCTEETAMKNRDMLIAEAVLAACYEAIRDSGLYPAGSDLPTINLPAIIANVETPKPYCWVVSGCSIPFYGEFAENGAKQEAKRVGGTCEAIPLYTAPPAARINQQLLDALKILVKFNTRDWYDGACAPAEVRIAKTAIAAAECAVAEFDANIHAEI